MYGSSILLASTTLDWQLLVESTQKKGGTAVSKTRIHFFFQGAGTRVRTNPQVTEQGAAAWTVVEALIVEGLIKPRWPVEKVRKYTYALWTLCQVEIPEEFRATVAERLYTVGFLAARSPKRIHLVSEAIYD